MTYEEAKNILGVNCIGPHEIQKINHHLGFEIPSIIPEIQYSKTELLGLNDDYILILGLDKFLDSRDLTLLNLRDTYGIDSLRSEPCFYNQDWYLREDFVNEKLQCRWYLIKINIIEESRSISPEILTINYTFPSAILCAYTFFISWFFHQKVLWKNDFVWCSDIDHNGDRIYIGKCQDKQGFNKSGFSIHRHLEIRKFYGSICVY